MFNVRLPFVGEPAARVGTIDAAKLGDDPVLHRLRIPIVVSIVRGATGFGGNLCRNCLPLWVDQGDGGVVGSTKD